MKNEKMGNILMNLSLSGIEEDYEINGLVLQKSCFNINWVRELNVNPKTILDIGSYDGGDSIRFKQEFPHAEVYSFEGCPERQKIIEEYISQYNVNLVKSAVTDHTGTTQWYSATCAHKNKPIELHAAQGSIYQHNQLYKRTYSFIHQHKQTKVPCTNIHDFCVDHNITNVDVAHIDVEGSEYNVLVGLQSIRPKIIFVETMFGKRLWDNGNKNVNDVHDILISYGYILILDITSDRLYFHQ